MVFADELDVKALCDAEALAVPVAEPLFDAIAVRLEERVHRELPVALREDVDDEEGRDDREALTVCARGEAEPVREGSGGARTRGAAAKVAVERGSGV